MYEHSHNQVVLGVSVQQGALGVCRTTLSAEAELGNLRVELRPYKECKMREKGAESPKGANEIITSYVRILLRVDASRS